MNVQATNIAGDAILYNGDPTDQSFAIVCYNCNLGSDFTLAADPTSVEVCAPQEAEYTLDIGSLVGFVDPVTLSASWQYDWNHHYFDTNPVIPTGTSLFTVGNTGGATAGNYVIDVVGIAPTRTHTVTVRLNLFTVVPDMPVLITPADGAVDQPFTPLFDWDDLALSSGYNFALTSARYLNHLLSQLLV